MIESWFCAIRDISDDFFPVNTIEIKTLQQEKHFDNHMFTVLVIHSWTNELLIYYGYSIHHWYMLGITFYQHSSELNTGITYMVSV